LCPFVSKGWETSNAGRTPSFKETMELFPSVCLNTETDVSCPNNNKLNERQRNELPSDCKANKFPKTAQPNKQIVESEDRSTTKRHF